MAGDGKFFWWYGNGCQPETYQGPFDSREQAIAQARSEDGDEDGFTICEADRSVPTSNIFDSDHVLERYEEVNEECWGEDGADITIKGEQARDLESMLAAALDTWFDKHGTRPRPWAFHTQRSEEYFAPVNAPAEQ